MALASARRCAGLTFLAAPLGALAIAVAPAAAANIADSGNITNPCPKSSGVHRVFSAAGKGATCAQAPRVMRAWTKAHKPKRFRGYRCGEVKRTTLAFEGGRRWFATWQCARAGQTYVIWTRY
jgi:hypothetical protein